jgi:Kef-type K+ transport system membrane component KefB
MNFTALFGVSVIALAAPLAAFAARRLRLPGVVLEIAAGIVIGPSVLGWIHVDAPIAVVSGIGLAMLLFLAGREVDFSRFKGRVLAVAALGMAISLALALAVGLALAGAGLVRAPLFVAITLTATGLGVLTPIFKDAPEVSGGFGRLVVAGATVGEFTPILLLTLLFSRTSAGAAKAVLLAAFALLALAASLALLRLEGAPRVMAVLTRLQDTTAQIRVRFAVVVFTAFTALAGVLGLETILGAFVAGAMLRLIDRDADMAHPLTTVKLEALGFGFLIPVFFVASGLRFDLRALLANPSTIALVPLFLGAQLLVRGLPALAYARLMDRRGVLAAALFQATSLSFPIAATLIGLDLRLIDRATASALVAAGMISTLLFPPLALTLLAGAGGESTGDEPAASPGASGRE